MRTRAIPERLRGVITTRRYTNPRLPYLTYMRLSAHPHGHRESVMIPSTGPRSCVHVRRTLRSRDVRGRADKRVGSGRVEIPEIYFLTAGIYGHPNLSMLNYSCNVQFTVFHFVLYRGYFSCMPCLHDIAFFKF